MGRDWKTKVIVSRDNFYWILKENILNEEEEEEMDSIVYIFSFFSAWWEGVQGGKGHCRMLMGWGGVQSGKGHCRMWVGWGAGW